MSHRYEKLAVLKMFARLFCLQWGKTLKKVWEKLYTSKTEKKRRSRDDLKRSKLAQILEQSGGTRQVCRFLFPVHCTKPEAYASDKTNRLNIAVHLFSNRLQKTSKCGKIIRDALPCGSFATCLFFPRHLWSITEQTHGNMESLS